MARVGNTSYIEVPPGGIRPHEHDGEDITSGRVAPPRLGSGTRDGTKFLRDDGTWQASSPALPTTTKGDLIVHNGSANVRLGVGTNTYVLTADSAETTGLKWATAGASDHGALTGLSDDDHTQYLALAGRAGGQVIASGDAGEPTVEVRRAGSGSPNIVEFANSTGATTLATIDNDGSYNATPGSNLTTPLVDLTQGAGSGTYLPNTAALIRLGATQATSVGGIALEVRRGPGGGDIASALTWDGSVISYATASSGIRWKASDAGATKFLFRGVSDREAEFSLGSISNSTTRTYTLPDASGTVALTSDITSGAASQGEMYFTGNSTATTITTTDTWTKVGITTTLSVSDDFDSPSAGRLRYTGATTKTFRVIGTLTIEGAAAADTVYAMFYKNGTVNGNQEFTAGTQLTQTTVSAELGGIASHSVFAMQGMVSLATNDYVEVAIKNATDADDLTVHEMNVSAVGPPSTTAQVSDGDKGDITTSSGGSTWTIDSGAVTYAKMQATASASRILGRGSASAGTITELTAGNGIQIGASSVAAEAWPVGSVFIAVVSTNPNTLLGYGTWSAFGTGRVLVGIDAGDADFDTVEETGGAKTVASAGTVGNESSHTHSVTSNVTVDNHASHTHDYTQVVNHTHTVNIGSGNDTSTTTGSGNVFAGTTSSVTATTANPSGGVATGTTAGPSATLTHTVTNNAVTSAAGSSHTHTYTGSATSVVQPYIVVYMWKRTA